MMKLIRGFGRGLRNGLVALGALAFLGTAVGLADYAATQGSGTNFASVVISAVHYAAHVVCDATVGETRCAAVDAHGQLQIDTATTNSNIYAALTAAVPCLNATAFNTNSYSTGQTNPLNCDTHGNAYVNIGTAPTITTTTAAADPCQANAQVILPFTIPTNTTTNVLTGTSAKKIYVCYLYMQTGLANNVAVIEGTTGGTCGSSTKALVGGTTAATGLLNAANSGQAFGNGGFSVLQTTVTNNDICMITSASGPLSGVMKYVLQ